MWAGYVLRVAATAAAARMPRKTTKASVAGSGTRRNDLDPVVLARLVGDTRSGRRPSRSPGRRSAPRRPGSLRQACELLHLAQVRVRIDRGGIEGAVDLVDVGFLLVGVSALFLKLRSIR